MDLNKATLNDLGRMSVDAVSWTKQDIPCEKTYNKAFRLVVKITGTAISGYGDKRRTMSVTDEIVEVRLLALSSYKSVYVKFRKELFEFFCSTMDRRFSEDRFMHEKECWFLASHHDSCWRDGMSLTRFFDYETTFDIIEVGLGKSTLQDEPDTRTFGSFYRSEEREKYLLSDLIEIERWNIDSSNHWNFWTSFMKEMSLRGYVKGYELQFVSTGGKFHESNVHVSYDSDGNATLVTVKDSKKNSSTTLTKYPFSKELSEKLFKNMRLNFVSDHHEDLPGFIKWQTYLSERDGYTVDIKTA